MSGCSGSNFAEKMKAYIQTVWFPDSSFVLVEDNKVSCKVEK